MNIILNSLIDGGTNFNLMELFTYLSRIPDTRDNRGKIYPLPVILTYIILAKLAGHDTPTAIHNWVKLHQTELLSLFESRHQRVPCLNVYRTILSEVVTMDDLMKTLNQYLLEVYGGQTSPLIAIDGKTMKGTIPKGETRGVHLLSAYLSEEGITLAQKEVGSKENEITVAKDLIEELSIKNRVVCADAMQTQRELSVQIKARGGDYIWIVKNNQSVLKQDVAQFFAPPRKAPGWHTTRLPQTIAETTDLGHGRLEKRTLTLMIDQSAFLDWPHVEQVFMLRREVTFLKSGHMSCEIVYGVTSCSPERVSAEQLLAWIRQYWGIENGLHYRRDVTLHEDQTRFSLPNLAKSMAAINNFVIGLVRKLGLTNLAQTRRQFAYQITSQLMA